MEKTKLYKMIADKWPEELPIGDYTPMGIDCFLTPSLDNYYRKLSEVVGVDDPWLDIGCWAFREALRDKAKNNFVRGLNSVKKTEVTLEQFDKYLRSNLEDESWAQEREEYLKLNP